MSRSSSSSRRRFVTASSAALVTGFTAGCASETPAPPAAVEAPANRVVPALTEAARNAMTPDAILTRAREGNRRFLEGKERPRDFLAEQRATAAGQFPAAAVLSCIDSRGSAEIIVSKHRNGPIGTRRLVYLGAYTRFENAARGV